MPNWMTTRCKVSGTPEQIREFRAFALSGEPGSGNQNIDFHKIVPMPEIIRQAMKNNEKSENRPSLEAAFFLLLLNGGEGLSPEFFASQERGLLWSSGLTVKREKLVLHKEEIFGFLDAINPETGVSTKTLSDEILVEAIRATAENELLGNSVKGNQQWLKFQIAQQVSGKYTDEQLEVFSLAELTNICKTLPGVLKKINSGISQLRILAETGYVSWYEWSVENWGVRWPPDSITMLYESKNNLDFRFNTAWDFPEPIFSALGEKFPDMEIWCACIDEETMECGYGHFAKIYSDDEEDFSFRGKDVVYHIHPAIRSEETGEEPGSSETQTVYFVYSRVFDKNNPGWGDSCEEGRNRRRGAAPNDKAPPNTP